MKYRHKKLGTTYDVLGVAPIECRANTMIREGDDVCVYLDHGKLAATAAIPNKDGAIIVGLAEVQTKRDLRLGDHIYVYREEGSEELWAVPAVSFEDGRYERVA